MQLHKCCEPFFRKARSVNAADTAHASPDRAWPSLAFYVKKTDSCRVLFVSHLKVIPKAFQSYSKGLKLGKWCHFWIVNLVLEALLTPAFPAREQRAKNESRCSLEFVLTHDCIRPIHLYLIFEKSSWKDSFWGWTPSLFSSKTIC